MQFPLHAVPGIVQAIWIIFGPITGRQYHLVDYFGEPDAERVIVLMGSGAEAAGETVEYLWPEAKKSDC